ncbi:MAG TPA: magnesium/cobalt transporter CorA [Pelomicrobium sp.]|nr:magnesium/cobalt transporter CorA [Pelomicrobium sp.]
MDSAPAAVIDCAAYAGGRRLRRVEVDEVGAALAQDAAFVWLGLYEPNEALMRRVQAELGLHDLAVEDAHRAHQRPKLEAYGDSLFVVLHTVRRGEAGVEFGETHVFVGPRYVVSVRHRSAASYAPVRQRCERMPELLAHGPSVVLYAIMDFVVDNYFPVMEALEDDFEALEERMFEAPSRAELTERIYALKREVMALRRALLPLTEVSNQLLYSSHALVREDVRPYFRDVHDHATQIFEANESMREMLTSALSVNLALVTVRQNEVVKKLAGWGAVLAIPVTVASVYGMNFRHMPELEWTYGYPLVVALTAAAAVLLHRGLKRAGWV